MGFPDDDLRHRVSAGERLVAECSQRLLACGPDELDAEILNALGAIGEFVDADAGHFACALADGEPPFWLRWVRPGTTPNVGADEVTERLMGWGRLIASIGEPLFFCDLDKMPDEALGEGASFIRRMRSHSLAVFPVTPKGQLDGIASFAWRESAAPTRAIVLSTALIADVLQSAARRVRAERTMLAQTARFEALVRNAAEGLLIINPAGEIEFSSSNVADFLGLDPTGSDRDASNLLVHPEDQADVQAAFERVLADPDNRTSVTFRVAHADGSERFIEMEITNLLRDRAIRGVVMNARDVSERVAAAAELEWAATHDRLTGAYNPNALLDRIQTALEAGSTPALLTVALDRFRVLNDSLGHDAGNQVLRAIADRLQSTVRAEDAVARVGGDEFAVLFTDVANDAHLDQLIERILGRVREPVPLDELLVQISASAGVATIEPDTNDPTTLLRASDSAMARAKRSGNGHVVRFHADLRREARRRLQLEQAIHRALANDEFVLHYQPIVDLSTGRTVGAEALVRWLDPARGMVSPGEFIPVAEETGQIIDIGRWVLDTAACDASRWYSEFGTTISVNVAVHQLVDAQFPDLVHETMVRHHVAPEALCFELTETGDTDAWAAVAETLTGLRAIGSRIAMDDLGTGYATLERLRHLPVDVVKLDAGHVGRIEGSPVDAAIVRALTELAKAMDVVLVAEGVETAETHAQLQQLGATLGQGYLYGRPSTAADYELRLTGPWSAHSAADTA